MGQLQKVAQVAEEMGLSLLPDNNTHVNRMNVKSASSNRLYVVSQSKATGEWQCSCPAWVMKKPGKPRGCKHLDSILPALGEQPRRIG